MKNKYERVILVFFLISIFSGCIKQNELILVTTTSTCDTGLLDVVNKKFEEANNALIYTVCEGTGKAIATGELGAADVVIVHAVQAELNSVANKSFINRTYIMSNFFVIIGPESDPAGIKTAKNASDAFNKIAVKKQYFISRGDDSGTHKMEKSIWQAANITPAGTWYLSVGRGMMETITTADIKGAYTLSDRGTFLSMKEKIKLKILFESDMTFLFNPYHVMAVNPEKYPNVNYELAIKYIDYLASPSTQEIISNYGKEKYGEALFIPAVDNK
ncbi:MAG: tungsten ABC transporter substrate-binding protein [Methanosarcinales archaeon]|nr:MAG: tungsten ABC transporter substrate-binding protein [Methanosarcinales archaeon]